MAVAVGHDAQGFKFCRTYVFVLEYDGSNYDGFQRQQTTTRCSNALPPATGQVLDIESTPSRATLVELTRKDFNCSEMEICGMPVDYWEEIQNEGNRLQRCAKTKQKDSKKNGGRTQTIQDFLEMALVRLTGLSKERLRVRSAGRTDKGVHATGQIVAFDYFCKDNLTECQHNCIFHNKGVCLGNRDEGAPAVSGAPNPWQLRRAINSRLPHNICVRKVIPYPILNNTEHLWSKGIFEPRQNVALKRYTYTFRFRTRRFLHNNDMSCCTHSLPFSAVSRCNTSSEDNNIIRTANQNGKHCTDYNNVNNERQWKKRADTRIEKAQRICSSGIHTIRRAFDNPPLWICPWSLDDRLFTPICCILKGRHDFSCFVHKAARWDKSNLVDLKTFHYHFLDSGTIPPSSPTPKFEDDIVESSDIDLLDYYDSDDGEGDSDGIISGVIARSVRFTLEATGFRRGMVRNLIGFLVDVARGQAEASSAVFGGITSAQEKRAEQDSETVIPEIFSGRDEASAVVNSAPACGLCLTKVLYEKDAGFR